MRIITLHLHIYTSLIAARRTYRKFLPTGPLLMTFICVHKYCTCSFTGKNQFTPDKVKLFYVVPAAISLASGKLYALLKWIEKTYSKLLRSDKVRTLVLHSFLISITNN